MLAGEKHAWALLLELSPQDVCRRAKVAFERLAGVYILKSFLQDIHVSPKNRVIHGHSPISDLLLNKLHRFSILSILWYLINAKDIPLSGELKRPADMSGGQIYWRGSHILPLNKIAEKYSSNIEEFLERGKELGGEQLSYGDASLRLFPFPRVAVTILLWGKDAEFSSHADLLFDSTCELQLPPDIIWATAMMSILIML